MSTILTYVLFKITLLGYIIYMNIGFVGIILNEKNGIQMNTCILRNATEQNLRVIIEKNLQTLDKILDYLIENNIHLFRISSVIIPFASHPVNKIKWWEDYKGKLKELGKKAKKHNIRLSMHPGQYTTLSSLKDDLTEKSILELQYHTTVLDALEMPQCCKVILHIGGTYGDKQGAMERFISNYKKLPKNIKNRLVIENDDKCYTAEDVLYISSKTKCPVIFDYLHFLINHECTDTIKMLQACRETWKKKDGIQKIHYSQQAEGKRLGSHSQTINPEVFCDFTKILPEDIDIMFEVKDKNISVLNWFNFCATKKGLNHPIY